jgi:hypothetical protein
MLGDALNLKNIEMPAPIIFYCKAMRRGKFALFKIETLGEYAPIYATDKTWAILFIHGDFNTCDAPSHGRHKTVTTPEIVDQIHEAILKDHRLDFCKINR